MKGKLILTVEEAEQDHDKWLAVRNSGIGGSDAAVVVGHNPWKSAYALWAEKTGQVEAEDMSDNEYIYWGNVLEQVVANRFCELTGKKVRKCGTLQDEEFPFLLANVDRVIVGENAILECKTTASFKKEEWVDDELPTHYYLQVQHYLGVTGCEKAYIAVLIGGNHFVWKEIPRCESDIADLRTAAVKFWNENVLGGVMPEPDGTESSEKTIKEQYQTDNGMIIPLESKAEFLIDGYLQACDAVEALKKSRDNYKQQLQVLLGNNQRGIVNGRMVSWVTTKGRTTIDSKLLKKNWPDIYEQVAKPGQSSRRFSAK